MNRGNNKQQQPFKKWSSDLESPFKVRTRTTTTTRSNNLIEANMGAGQKATAPTSSSKQTSKLIKKAYVRFDDYLDLNEENMRRSCKRLMNHLYSEPCSSSSCSIVAPAISCQSQTVKCLTPTGAPIKSVASSRSLPQTPLTLTATTSSGKSYLRLQYERRQLRQLELMNKMMQEEKGNQHIAVGANAHQHQQQQQDLVAKSHELSKRRFFEKLERRKSLKNLNFSTQAGKQYTAVSQAAYENKQQQETDSKQKGPDNDDELMLKVYQSIVLKVDSSEVNREEDTLGRLDGTLEANCDTMELVAGELIGFYTPSLQSPAYEQDKLIEFSAKQEEFSKLVALPNEDDYDGNQTAFEIKVPATASCNLSSGSQALQPADGFISSGLLVVKQVDVEARAASQMMEMQVTDAADSPHTLSGRYKGEASTQVAGNKTKTPLVDFTDNKVISASVEQINGQATNIGETMAQARATVSSNESVESSIGSDNQQQTVSSISSSSVISSSRNTNSNKMMKTISSSLKVDNQTTGHDRSGEQSNMLEESDCKQQPAIEVGGETNRGNDHDAPEMGMVVGQSGGAAEIAEEIAAISELNSAYPVQTESAAQAQQVARLQTTITKPAIRDVLPEANGTNWIEVIVSDENDAAKKVIASSKQIDEVQQQGIANNEGPESDDYANHAANENGVQINNVNHEVSEITKVIVAMSKTELIDENSSHLIESFKKRSNLVQKQSINSTEDDRGSSCSSSGFGASVSVTCSSDAGSSSINDTISVAAGPKREPGNFRRPTSLTIMLPHSNDQEPPDGNPLYDSVRVPRNWVRIKSTSEFSDYKQLVGPDQAYPKSRTLLIENDNYASVLNCQNDLSQLDANRIALEKDDLAQDYANLPRKKALPVEYATVRPTPESNKKRPSKTSSDASLSDAKSYSTASADSGGFSALPTVQTIDSASANNFESLVSLAEGQQRKSSLLKRFGSLVSKAFTLTAVQSVTSKINESPLFDRQQLESSNANNGQKSALVIERNHQAGEQEQVGEADLVILPTKHVNQRTKQEQSEQNPTARRHDDRLSRGKKYSRSKIRQTDSSLVASSSSSFFSSSSSDTRHRCEHPKRADSLSGELESLMSQSEHSANSRNQNSSKSAFSSYIHQPSTANRLIDVDCISPTKITNKSELDELQSMAGNSANPRSLLHLFKPASQRAAKSTPNLDSSTQIGRSHLNPSQCGVKTSQLDYAQQPISGFWGFSNLKGHSHATTADTVIDITKSKLERKLRKKPSLKLDADRDPDDRDSLMYTNLQPFATGYKLHLSTALPQEQQLILDKYQSSRDCVKRRHRHHGHHHRYHHHHHRAHHSSSRHAHHSTRCAQNIYSSSSSSEIFSNGCIEEAVVSGQLIKINKSDGSQVIELQRSPGKSWGFFVARGAINNNKGIFISRMHDNITSNSLTGLLSIGDRILAIDECPIEPDYDILRVNQLISKKSKILLKVKPFKG